MSDSPTPLVQVRTTAGVTTLTLNSPHNRNALSTPLMTELRAGLAEAVADPQVRVVVLDHTGPVFCSGVDLKETEAARAAGTVPAAMMADLLAEVWQCPKPVLAQVGGPARAGGLGVIAAADLAFCSTEATFAFTEVRLGVIPAVISATVLRRIDSRAAAALYLTGEVFDGAHAERIGLVTQAVPADELAATVHATCQAIVRAAPRALSGTKQLLRRPPETDITEELRTLSELSVGYFLSDDAREGIAAFRERRDPTWVPTR